MHTGVAIVRAFIRTYTDSGQMTGYVVWSDGSRTEGRVCLRRNGIYEKGPHLEALFDRAVREGLTIERETW